MICVYPPNCTDFSNNGLGAVRPQSCTVTETLNGEWELTLVHPIDELGKWQRLTEGCILRAPVPAAMTPQINLVTQQYQTTTYDVEIYKISTNKDPLRLRSGTGTKYKILGKYKKGTEVIVLDKTTSSWYEVTCPDGKHGYMSSEYLTYVRTDQESTQTNVGFTNSTIESRQLRDQPFRIYRVVPELNRVTVHARHIFYDLLDNMVKSIKPASDAVGASVVQSISDGCLSEHDFTFYSDLETTASDVVLENINPVEALLGEDGVTGKYGAELARDWFDVFLVSRVGTGSDVQIREKKNLTGISFDVDETDVVTRIMPTGEDADGNMLYLPELYIDSPNINAYPHPKWIHLPVADAKEVTEGDETRTKEECYKAMRDAVQAEYDAGCDLPTVTLKVDFINCKDTEEYRQFAALTNIFLGDSVRVIARRIGIEVTMRMTQYTYDCLTKKYTSVTLGTAAETLEGTMVAARQLASGSITGVKLALNSIGSGHLQSGSVGSLQVKNAAIQTAHIRNAAITRAHIAEALIETLNVNALNAVTARIQELAAGQITTDELYASIAMIAAAQLTTANIVQANIQWAQIQTLATEIATISKAQINTATINSANIDWAAIITLTAAVSTMIKADIGTADIDWSHIKDLATDTAIITEGTAGQLYITRLAVTEANMVSLTVGELVVKGSDGHFYAVGVDKNGNVVTTLKQVVNDDVADLSIHGTEKLIEGSITAQTLNVQEIFGDNATIRSLIAANIDVDILFAREATLNAINAMDITGNTYLKLMVSKKADQTAVDALSERVNAAELKITADAIVSTVRSSTAYTTDLAGKASTSAVATAQTTANSAQTTANSAQSSIDRLDIGGRNLLKNSAGRPVLSGSDFSSASQRVEGMITTLLETQGNAHYWVQNSLAKTPAEITESIGAEYSFSVDVKVTGSFSNLCVSFDVRPAETHSYLLICTAYHDGTTYDQWIRLKGTGTVKGIEGARSLICITWSSSMVGSTIEYRNFKVEAGNRATDWTPAPEDVEAGIADAQSAADNAQSTAENAQTTADNAQSAADNAQSAANTNASNIATLVTRMTSAEQKITADAIVSTVTKSETYTTDLAAVQSAASGAQSSADKAQSTIDSLQIGGRNLLPDSKGDFVLTPKNTGAAGDNFNYYRFYCDMMLNETYTISADIEVTAGEYDSVSIYPYPGGSSAKAIIPENGRVVCTFTKSVDTIDSVLIYAGSSGATRGNGAIIRNVKIEKGNRATDWTPAPEDVDAGIADAQSAAETAQSAASSAQESADNAQNSADSAQSAADKAQSTANTNASNIATLTTRMTSAEQKITADAIVSTVRSSTAYTTDLAGKASTSAVVTAQSTADSAKAAASTAQSAADKAQSTANSAQSAASAAQSTANSAQTAANTAQSSANSAKSAADAAQITADTARTAADAAQSSIDSLDIGGRNLLMNSANAPALTGSDHSSVSERASGKITTLTEAAGNAYTWVQTYMAKTPAEITESGGAEYSFSVDARVTGSFSNLCASFDVRPADTHTKQLNIPAYHDGKCYDQWVRLKATGTVTGTAGARALISISWGSSIAGSTIEYRNFKLEAGNRATDWIPAPEDVDAGIADAQSAAENAQSTANTAQSTADKAQSTANTNASNITALTTRVTTAEQKITADAIVSTVRSSTAYTTDLAGKASTSAVATAQSAADKAQTTANTAKTTADSAKTTATSAQTTANQNATNITNLTTRVSNAESSITQNASNIALKVSTSTYNAEKVYRGSTAPTTLYTNMLWLDTSVTPNLLKRYTGSAWVVAGAQEVKSSGIYIGSNQVSITTEDFLLQLLDPSDNENVLMEMSADGNVGFKELYADEIISDSVAQAYSGSNYLWVVPSITTPTETDFRSLGEAVQAVNNRHLKEDVYIYLPYGSETYEPGGVIISGIFGSGRLVIYGYGENSILNSYIKVKGCFSNVCFQNVHLRESRSLNGSSRQPYLVEVQQCHFVEFNGCTLDANSITYDSVYARASHVFLYNCGLYNALQGLECYLATGNVKNCCGSCSWSMISYASIIFASGTVPAGSRGTGENGQLYATSVTVDYGTAIPTVTPDENGILYASTTRSWRGSWRTDTLDVIQGVYSDSGYSSSLNWHRGCMWFSTAKSLLSGCTVKSATLTLRRETGSGSGSAKTVYLCAITNTSASGTPSIAKNYGALGTIGRGKQVTFAIPVDAVKGLADGTYGGLCLYETPYNFGSSTYSNCYMRMNGTDTDYEPYIECVYSGSTGNG